MDELLIGNQLGYKVELLLEEVLYGLDVVVGYFFNFLDVCGILFTEILSYGTQTVK